MKEITKQMNPVQSLPILTPRDFNQLQIFANIASKSSFVPNNYKGKPEDIMLAVQMGSELGLPPL